MKKSMEARLFTTFPLLPLPLLLLLLILSYISTATSSPTAVSKKFIKTSCANATYPGLCYSSLSPYAATVKSDPWKLCGSALAVSLDSARKGKAAFSSLLKSNKAHTKAEKAAVKQCRDTMDESVDRLRQSVKIMSRMIRAQSSSSSSSSSYSSSEIEFQMSNVKTYVSGAITDDETCADGLEEEPVTASLKKRILKWQATVERLASNALSLVSRLKY